MTGVRLRRRLEEDQSGWQAGEFERFYELHQHRVGTLIRQLIRDRSLAEDVAQQVFETPG